MSQSLIQELVVSLKDVVQHASVIVVAIPATPPTSTERRIGRRPVMAPPEGAPTWVEQSYELIVQRFQVLEWIRGAGGPSEIIEVQDPGNAGRRRAATTSLEALFCSVPVTPLHRFEPPTAPPDERADSEAVILFLTRASPSGELNHVRGGLTLCGPAPPGAQGLVPPPSRRGLTLPLSRRAELDALLPPPPPPPSSLWRRLLSALGR